MIEPHVDRSKIAMDRPDEVKYWIKHLGITKELLRRTVEKVGNSAAAVRKELRAGPATSLAGRGNPPSKPYFAPQGTSAPRLRSRKRPPAMDGPAPGKGMPDTAAAPPEPHATTHNPAAGKRAPRKKLR
jgi:hypothetical protein